MLNLRAVVIFLAAATSAEANVCFQQPEKIASYIFTESPDFYTYKKSMPGFVSSNLGTLLGRDWNCQELGDLCALDVYPWTQTQDGEALEPVQFHATHIEGAHAIVEMTYTFGWADTAAGREARRNELSLVRENASNCWRLDDISSGEWSLKETLANWPYYQE